MLNRNVVKNCSERSVTPMPFPHYLQNVFCNPKGIELKKEAICITCLIEVLQVPLIQVWPHCFWSYFRKNQWVSQEGIYIKEAQIEINHFTC